MLVQIKVTFCINICIKLLLNASSKPISWIIIINICCFHCLSFLSKKNIRLSSYELPGKQLIQKESGKHILNYACVLLLLPLPLYMFGPLVTLSNLIMPGYFQTIDINLWRTIKKFRIILHILWANRTMAVIVTPPTIPFPT